MRYIYTFAVVQLCTMSVSPRLPAAGLTFNPLDLQQWKKIVPGLVPKTQKPAVVPTDWITLVKLTESGDREAVAAGAQGFISSAKGASVTQVQFAQTAQLIASDLPATVEMHRQREELDQLTQREIALPEEIEKANAAIASSIYPREIDKLNRQALKQLTEEQRNIKGRKALLEKSVQSLELRSHNELNSVREAVLSGARNWVGSGESKEAVMIAQLYIRLLGRDPEVAALVTGADQNGRFHEWLESELAGTGLREKIQQRRYWEAGQELASIELHASEKWPSPTVRETTKGILVNYRKTVDDGKAQIQVRLADIATLAKNDSSAARQAAERIFVEVPDLPDMEKHNVYLGITNAEHEQLRLQKEEEHRQEIEMLEKWNSRIAQADAALDGDLRQGIQAFGELVKEAKDDFTRNILRGRMIRSINKKTLTEIEFIEANVRRSMNYLGVTQEHQDQQIEIADVQILKLSRLSGVSHNRLLEARSLLAGATSGIKTLETESNHLLDKYDIELEARARSRLAVFHDLVDAALTKVDETDRQQSDQQMHRVVLIVAVFLALLVGAMGWFIYRLKKSVGQPGLVRASS